jgi:NitT/TauT family transport system substrate-binding protein
MDRRQFLSGSLACCAFPFLQACQPAPPLRVGITPWIGYETLLIAHDFHWLPDSIEMKRGLSVIDSLDGLVSGELDAACLTLDEMLRARDNGLSLTAITIFDISAGADMVISRADTNSLSDLKGKRIGVDPSSVGILMLTKLLEHANLTREQITLVHCPFDQHQEYWVNNRVDAMITYEPTASQLQQLEGHVLFDSQHIPELIFDVLAVRTDRLDIHQHNLTQLVAAHFKGLRHTINHHQDTLYRIAAHQAINVNEVQHAYNGVILPSLEANRDYLTNENGRFINAAKEVLRILAQHNILSSESDLADFMSAAFLPTELSN